MLDTHAIRKAIKPAIVNCRQKEASMPRVSRMIVHDQVDVYHVMSRTALDGYPLLAFKKDYLVELIKHMANLFFTEIFGYCVMGNHFHALVKMIPEYHFTDEEVKKRLVRFYGEKKAPVGEAQLPMMRQKLASLAEFVREIKVNFTRFYSKRNGRRGYFWRDRFKSLIVERGETLVNCLAYIDLNPVRVGIVDKSEDYRWNSLGYHLQTGNKDGFLSTDFGLGTFNVKSKKERVRRYRKYVYEAGAIQPGDSLLFEIRISWPNPASIAPRANRILAQPSPNGFPADRGNDSLFLCLLGNFIVGKFGKRKTELLGQLTGKGLDRHNDLRGKKRWTFRAVAFPGVQPGVAQKNAFSIWRQSAAANQAAGQFACLNTLQQQGERPWPV
jgi:putative transposase